MQAGSKVLTTAYSEFENVTETGTKGHVSSLCPTYLRALPQMAALHNWAGGDPPDHQGCRHTGLILPPHHLLVPPLIQMLGTH